MHGVETLEQACHEAEADEQVDEQARAHDTAESVEPRTTEAAAQSDDPQAYADPDAGAPICVHACVCTCMHACVCACLHARVRV